MTTALSVIKRRCWRGPTRNGTPRIEDFPGTTAALMLSLVIPAFLIGAAEAGTIGLVTVVLLITAGSILVRVTQLRRHLVPVTSETFPKIDFLVDLACQRLGVLRPPVYIQGDPTPNAFSIGFDGPRGIIVLTSGLAEFPEAELLFALGHEIGHISKWHSPISTALDFLVGTVSVPVLSAILRLTSGRFRIRSEYSVDRFGLVAADGDVLTACRALIRASAGTGGVAPSLIEDDTSWLSDLAELLGTHPFLARRLRTLERFAREMYR